MSETSLFTVQEYQEPIKFGVSASELQPKDRRKLGQEEPESGNDENREEEVSEKSAFGIRRKRRRSEEVEEEGEDDDDDLRQVDNDDDGFKTPTRPENVIPESRQCPPAPRKPRPESSVLSGSKTASCRRRLEFSSEDIDWFIADLQRKTTTKKKRKKID